MSITARSRARRSKGLAFLVLLLLAGAAYAQIWTGNEMWRGWRGEPPRFATRALKDGSFHFCRLMYPSAYREAGGDGRGARTPGGPGNITTPIPPPTKT